MILVGGEALYDLVVQEEGDELRRHPGGGPFNTARTAGRLGQPVAYLGRLSSDRFGRRLETLLGDDGVNLDCVVRTDEPPRWRSPRSTAPASPATGSTRARRRRPG